mgnify:CR=1 FL=1
MGEWQVEDKHQGMAEKEATRMNRLISSLEDTTVSDQGANSSEHDEHLTPEQREEARLNKRLFPCPLGCPNSLVLHVILYLRF